ncbi:MAG TPA: hypothetical protein VJ672_11395 [Gemmatimonadaceae bacterium]|nr:hypothetical protein [Gemmatimonadaceae bacterium]
MERSPPTVQLRVADASLADVAEGRARISREEFDALALTPGSLVRIRGEAPILADAYPAGAEDDGLGLIRLDGTQRHRLRVSLGDTVEVARYDAADAVKIRCRAIGSSRALDVSPYDVHAALLNHMVTRGDTFSISPSRRDFEARVSLLGLSVVDVVGSSAGAHAALVRVVETHPSGVVRVVSETEIEIAHAGESDDESEA